MGGYTSNRLIQNGLPVKWHRVKKNRFRVIDIEDFWKWAEKNKSLLDFSRFDKYTLGAEPDWVDEKRKADLKSCSFMANTTQPGQKQRTTSSGTCWRRTGIHTASWRRSSDIQKEPSSAGSWTLESRLGQFGAPPKMDRGRSGNFVQHGRCRIRLHFDRRKTEPHSTGHTRKFERLQNPEYNKRYNRGQNRDYEYQGIRSISGKGILKDRKLMDGVEFQELQPATNQ